MSRPILIDVDGVCIDWSAGFHEWMKPEPRTFGYSYDLRCQYPHIAPSAMADLVAAFNASKDFRDLPLMPGVKLGVEIMREEFHNNLLFAVSACGTAKNIVANREHQLRELPLNGLITLPLGTSKAEVFRQFRNAIVIEDAPDQKEASLSAGHFTVCMDQPWNQDFNPRHRFFMRVHGWMEIVL